MPTYQRIRTRQPYLYVIGPCDAPGARQVVMDVHDDLRDTHPDLPDHLCGMGVAVWQSTSRTEDPVAPGFAFRLVRLETADYNRLVAHANAAPALDATGYRSRGEVRVRYLRKSPPTPGDEHAWDITPWLEPDARGIDFGTATLPAGIFERAWPAPAAPPDDLARPYDGQHRLN